MKGSLVKLNFVSTLLGKAQFVIFYRASLYDFINFRKEAGGVGSNRPFTLQGADPPVV